VDPRPEEDAPRRERIEPPHRRAVRIADRVAAVVVAVHDDDCLEVVPEVGHDFRYGVHVPGGPRPARVEDVACDDRDVGVVPPSGLPEVAEPGDRVDEVPVQSDVEVRRVDYPDHVFRQMSYSIGPPIRVTPTMIRTRMIAATARSCQIAPATMSAMVITNASA
jgi:hypothetical protein